MKRLLKSPKHKKRLVYIFICSVLIVTGLVLILNVFKDNIIFFYTPSDLYERRIGLDGRIMRIGGLVKEKSVITLSPSETQFIITDLNNSVLVYYKGIIPALFKEGQGVVALGRLEENNRFRAIELLAKHDENYMPKEVQKALEKSGRWKPYNQR